MLIVMKADATDAQIAHVCDVITELGLKPHSMPGAMRTAIGITGNQGAVDPTRFENLPGVADAIRVSKPYKLISLDLRPEKTIVRVAPGIECGFSPSSVMTSQTCAICASVASAFITINMAN